MIKIKKTFFSVMYLSICLLLSGCFTSMKAYPDRSGDIQSELESLAIYFSPDVMTKYNHTSDTSEEPKKNRGGLSQKAYRNEVVNGRVRAIDLQFNLFQQALFQEGVGLGIGTDWIVLALGGLGSLYSSASQALSAASTGVVGAKASFDKNAFFDKTMPTLIATMVALRKEALVPIRTGLNKDINEYPFEQALVDAETYYNVGTIPGALIGISEDSGEKAKKADEILKTNLVVSPVPQVLQNRRKAAADFVRTLNQEQLETLAKSLSLSTDGNLSLKIRIQILAAQSKEAIDLIAQKLQILFQKEI